MPVEDISFLSKTIKTIQKYSTKKVFGTLQKINEIENLDKENQNKKRACEILN